MHDKPPKDNNNSEAHQPLQKTPLTHNIRPRENTSAYKILHRRASESMSLKDRLAAFQDVPSQSLPNPPTTRYNNNATTAKTSRGNEGENVKPKTWPRGLSFRKKNSRQHGGQRYELKSTIESLQRQQDEQEKKNNKNQRRPSMNNRRASFTRRVSLTKVRRSSISRCKSALEKPANYLNVNVSSIDPPPDLHLRLEYNDQQLNQNFEPFCDDIELLVHHQNPNTSHVVFEEHHDQYTMTSNHKIIRVQKSINVLRRPP